MRRVPRLLVLFAALLVAGLTVSPPALQASTRPQRLSAARPTLDAVNCFVTPAKTSLSSDEQAFLTLLNNFRAKGDPAGSSSTALGLPAAGPVQLDARLVASSAWFSQDHAQNGYQTTDPTGHNNPDHVDSLGRYIDRRLGDCDFPTTIDYAENVWYAWPPTSSGASAQGAFDGWYNLCDGDANGNNCTYQHRRTMLDPNATVAGIALAVGPKGSTDGQPTAHWTLDLGNPGPGNILAFPPQQTSPAPPPQAGPAGSPFAGQWTQLDRNQLTAEIVADGSKLYQRWSGGEIWQYTGNGTPCAATVTFCPGWTQLDNNHGGAVQVVAGGGRLYERESAGIRQYTGTPCQNQGTDCFGWQLLDNNSLTAEIVADGDKLYQRWGGGEIWQYTGTPCTTNIAGGTCTGWTQLDANHNTAQIAAAGGHLYQRWSGGQIWQYTGTPCQNQGTSCPGWQQLDDNTAVHIAAGGDDLYQLHSNGEVWRHNR